MKRRIAVALSIGVALVAILVASLLVPPYPVPAFTDVRSQWRAADAWLLDRNGERLSRVRLDFARRRAIASARR